MSDVGRHFKVTRLLELHVVLDEYDVADQMEEGQDAYQSAALIAGSTPLTDWTVADDDDVSELPN